MSHPATALLLLGLAAPALAQDGERLLPSRPEVKAHEQTDGEVLYSIRGRDATAADFLGLIVAEGRLAVVVDPLAEVPLRSTVLTIDLHEKRADFVIELIAAAAGVDMEQDLHVFRLMGPPRPGSGLVRTGQKTGAEKFYQMALTRQRDANVAAVALRGLAELHRRSGDFASAYAVYETLLSRYGTQPAAAGSELRLADCYMAVGDDVRAGQLLRSFLDRCTAAATCEGALRRLLVLLLENKRFAEIESLREGFLRLEALSPDTLARLSDAASAMIEDGKPQAAVLLLHDLWLKDFRANAVLGPTLALALVMQKDLTAAAVILRLSTRILAEDERSASALMAFAEIARQAGQVPEAAVLATSALRAEDAGPAVKLRANLLLSSIYSRLGLTLRARRHMYEAEQLSGPEEAGALALESAEMAIDDGEPERARLLFQEALQYPVVRVEAEFGIARSWYAAGEPERALDVLRSLAVELEDDKQRAELASLAIDCFTAGKDFAAARRVLNGDFAPLEAGGAP